MIAWMRVTCIRQSHSLSHERSVEPATGTSGGCHDDLNIPPAAVVGPQLVNQTEASHSYKHWQIRTAHVEPATYSLRLGESSMRVQI